MSKQDDVPVAESAPASSPMSGGEENVLLLAPTVGEDCDIACTDLLHVPNTETGAVVFVTLTQPPDARIEVLRRHASRLPSRVGVICPGENRRGGTGSRQGVAVRTVENPGDLARLGVAIGDALTDWTAAHPTTVCFHSITALLQFAELPRVFRFLYTLAGRVGSTGNRAHYHLDPDAHDQQTVSTLTPLFDSVVEVDDDGQRQII